MKRKAFWLLVPALVLALAGAVYAGGNVNNSTAQSVMFNTTMSGNFVMTDNEVYQYDREAAGTYFTNAWDGVVPLAVPQQGNFSGYSTVPTAPPAPPAKDSFLNASIDSNMCTFFYGGGLLVAAGNSTYDQWIKVDVPWSHTYEKYDNRTKKYVTVTDTGTDTYKFTYNYVITPNSTDPVAPRTAWTLLQSIPGEPVIVTLSGYLAAQTTVKKSADAKNPWTFKTAHNLAGTAFTDPVTGITTSSLTNVVATLTDADGNVVKTQPLTNVIQKGVDFFYEQNAGFNGPFAQLVNGALVSEIQQGKFTSCGFFDNFAGNDATLGDQAVLDPASFSVGPGNYTLTITGTLQGVAGVLPLNFSVTQQITYTDINNLCAPVVVTTP